MAKFAGRKGDLTWGKHDYSVTRTQKETLDALWYLMSGLPRVRGEWYNETPEGYFCSQRPDNGQIVMGLHNQSVTIHRNGRITSNQARR